LFPFLKSLKNNFHQFFRESHMRKTRSAVLGLLSLFFLSVFSGAFLLSAPLAAKQPGAIAEESRDFSQIAFNPLVEYDALTLTLSGPGGLTWTQKFGPGGMPVIRVADQKFLLPDGHYWYELVATPRITPKTRSAMEAGRASGSPAADTAISELRLEPLSGHFLVEGGRIVSNNGTEDSSAVRQKSTAANTTKDGDVVHNDDLIVIGSLCVGFDCVNDEVFGLENIKLKQNNNQILFDDTSTAAGFPANDWRIFANDTNSGGANKFSIEDVTGAKIPFTLIAGAPSNSIFVDGSGRLGLGTSSPAVNGLHIKTGNTPRMRLEQDSSFGWTAQTWDVYGNESWFVVSDMTSGKFPFAIKPGAPGSSIYIASNGNVGMSTVNPGYPLHVSRTGTNASVVTERTDGAKTYINATATFGNFGTVTNHPLRLVTNSAARMTLNSDNSVAMANGASLTAGGVWTDASSRLLKENIMSLTSEEALLALADLSPVKFNYRGVPSEGHVGFIAEDVPELVATRDRKGLSPMDIVAMLTKVVQEQQKTIQDQQNSFLEQRKTIQELAEKIRKLESR
jgi:hypothetical protein